MISAIASGCAPMTYGITLVPPIDLASLTLGPMAPISPNCPAMRHP
jgi:hypothetical protein